MSLKFKLPVVVNGSKSIDKLFRFDIGTGYFDGESPLKYLGDANIVWQPNASGLVFDSRPLRFYKSEDYYSSGSLFLTGNPYLKQVVSTDTDCYVAGILDADFKNFLSLTPNLSAVNGYVGDVAYSYSSYTKTCLGNVGNFLFLIQKNLSSPTLMRATAYDMSNGLSVISSASYSTISSSPFTVFEDSSGIFYALVDGSKNLRIYPYDTPTSLVTQLAISMVNNNDIGFIPDILSKTLLVFYANRILEITSTDTIRNSYLYGLSSVTNTTGDAWARGLIGQAGYVTSSNGRRLLLAVRYFKGMWEPDLSSDDINQLNSTTGIWLYDITDVNTTYYPSGRIYLMNGEAVRGVIQVSDTQFIATIINLYSGKTKLVLIDVSDVSVKTKSLGSFDEDIYLLTNDNGSVRLFSEKVLYEIKAGMAVRVDCEVSFDSSYSYPRTGTMNVKAYDIFGNEAYARVVIKLKSPNVVFEDGTTIKVVNFYPNNETVLNLKLLYSSLVSIETDILEVIT